MDSSLTNVIKEAMACASSRDVILNTLEFSHPNVGTPIYLVQDRVDHLFMLETSVRVTFTACAFQFTMPQSGDNGIQELGIQIDNVDQRVGDFVDAVKGSVIPVVVTYRPYISNDPDTVQQNPPLVLNLTDVEGDDFGFTGKASFADIVNKKFPTELYTRDRFPSLGN
jgi:hypothetical protein